MNQEKPKSVLAWYSTFTSVQGLVQFFASKNVVSKTYWFVIFAVSSIATCAQVYTVFEDYFSYNVVTDVKVIQNSSIDFPSVTICNTNRVHCGNLLKYASTCENQPGCNHTREEILCELYVVLDCSFSIREAEEFEHGHVISDVSYCAKHNFTFESKQNQTDKEIEQRFYDTYLKLLPDEVKAIAHNNYDMIKFCEFGGLFGNPACKKLISSRPMKFMLPRYGICYSFNFVTRHALEELVRSDSDGPDSGLSLVIDIEKSQYMRSGLSSKEGIVIALASTAELPNLLATPIQISPNTETNIAISLRQISRLKKPYESDCMGDYPPQITGPISDMKEHIYFSDMTCREACLVGFIGNKCNCVDPLSKDARQLTDFSTTNFCNVDYKSEERKCVNEARHDYMKYSQIDQHPCGCGLDCKHNKYMVSTSSSVWPSENYWGTLAETYNVTFNGETITYEGARDQGGHLHEKLKAHISSNYMKVNIYYKSLGIQLIIESPEYTLSTLLSALGGALSIFQGLTLLIIFETLELIFRFTDAALNCRYK